MASEMAPDSTEPAPEPQALFRGKKRKFYRQRADDRGVIGDNGEQATPSAAPVGSAASAQEAGALAAEDEGPSFAEALRLRNLRKPKIGGVAFTANQTPRQEHAGPAEDGGEQNLAMREGNTDLARSTDAYGMARRFAPQTGLVGELVNKHMEEYVESELARRNRSAADDDQDAAQYPNRGHTAPSRPGSQILASPMVPPRMKPQPMMQGKLQEIDLGEEARARNIALTERARRRLEGHAVEDDEESTDAPKKVRLGRDGKPWRPRNRRGSDDIKRDQLVEQFLSENKLDVYDVQPGTEGGPGGADDDDSAADDRIAEKFRREFMDAISQRQQRRKPAVNAPKVAPKAAPKAGEEVLKGPKLGGSRNVRAQMRDILLKEQEKKR